MSEQVNEQLKATLHFPPGFLWGTATASHQVEGNNVNNWSAWEALGEGRIFDDHVSGLACDWWNGRVDEDIERAAALHNNALRFSVEWSRVEPEPGCWDDDALAQYRDMIIKMRRQGLEPMVTLHHFTNPIWLEERGGWLAPDAPQRFAAYVARVVAALGDQVRLWCTINEPMVYSSVSYLYGKWPPGETDMHKALEVVAQLIRGHAAAYYIIKNRHPEAEVGLAKHQIGLRSGTPIIGSVGAWALNYMFNEAFFGPFINGKLCVPFVCTTRIPEARHTLDWIGLQYYARYNVCFDPSASGTFFLDMCARPDVPKGPGDWGELAPGESYARVAHLYKLLRCPIYITEMGVPDADDSIRPGYLAQTLQSVWQACVHTYPVKGFFFWSLLDNFEWAEGYDPRYRFGLYGVDFETQTRTERRSAQLYRAVCAANALSAGMVRQYAPEVFDDMFPAPRTTF